MSHQKKSLGLWTVVGAMGLVAASCGGSSGSPGDAGQPDVVRLGMGAIVSDGGDDGSDSAAAGSFDGTTGQPCTTNTDCVGVGGPGVNKCSNQLGGKIGSVTVTIMPTPVCVLPSCNPDPDGDPTGQFLHFCDGPDDPSSPGLCVPVAAGQGICLPACGFAFDGSAPTGCAGNDTCNPIGETTDATGAVTGGLGYCQGLCAQDSDCSALGTGWVCQANIGYCTQHAVAPTLAIGAACTSGSTACNCLADTTTKKGFCTSACIVGGSVACPGGWACDNGETSALMDGTPVATENIQTAGNCFQVCSLGDGGVEASAPATPEASTPTDAAADADQGNEGDGGASEGGSTVLASCPNGSVCQVQTPVGPECTP